MPMISTFSGRVSEVIFFNDLKLLFPMTVSDVQSLRSRVVRASRTLLKALAPIVERLVQPVKSIVAM